MTEPDPAIMLDILQLAEANAEAALQPLSMLFCLEAYDVVLPRFGIDKSKDLVYYQALLAMNIEGVYSHASSKLCAAEGINSLSYSCATKGRYENCDEREPRSYSDQHEGHCDRKMGPYSGEHHYLERNESVDHFLSKCRLMIMSDAFRAWKALTVEERRSELCIRAWNAKATEHFEYTSLKRIVSSWRLFAQGRKSFRTLLHSADNRFVLVTRTKLINILRARTKQRKCIQHIVNSARFCSIRRKLLSAIYRWRFNTKISENQFLLKKSALVSSTKRRTLQLWSNSMKSILENHRARLRLSVRYWRYRMNILRPNPLCKPDCFIQALLFWIDTSYSLDLQLVIDVRSPEDASERLQSACPLKWKSNSHANCIKRLRLLQQPTVILILRLWRFLSRRNRRQQKIVIAALVELFKKLNVLEFELTDRRYHLKRYWTLQSWHRVFVFESSFRKLNPQFVKIQQISLCGGFFKRWKSFLISRKVYNRNLSEKFLSLWRRESQKEICSKTWNAIADNCHRTCFGRRVFCFWKDVLLRKMNMSKLFITVSESHVQLIFTITFRKWMRVLFIRKQCAVRNEFAASWCKIRRKTIALRSWQTSQLINIRMKSMMVSAEICLKRSQCKKFISASLKYRELNVQRKIFCAKSLEFFQRFRSQETIRKLKWNVQKKKLVRTQLDQFRFFNLQQNWKLWRCVYVCNQVNRQLSRLRLSFVFKKFRNAVLSQRKIEFRIIANFDKRRRKLILACSLYEWARILSFQVLLRNLESRLGDDNNYRLLANHWFAWRSCYRKQLQMNMDCRGLQILHDEKLKHSCLSLWAHVLRRHLFRQTCLDKIHKLCRRHLLDRMLYVWRAALAAHLALDVNATLFARACRRRRQARFFRSWNRAVRAQLGRSQFADVYYHRRLLRHFNRWLCLFQYYHQRRAKLSRFLSFFQLHYLGRRFRHLVQRCAFKRLQAQALQRGLKIRDRVSVRRSFCSWRKHRKYLPVLRRICHFVSENLLRQSWTIWLSQHRQLFARNQVILRSIFQAWWRWSLQHASISRTCQIVASRRCSKLISVQWQLWRYFYQCAATADRFASMNLSNRYFRRWQSHLTFSWQSAKMCVEADRYYQRMLLTRVFRRVVVICFGLRQANDCISNRNSILLKTMLDTWLRLYYVNRAADRHDLQRVKSRFHCWRRFASFKVFARIFSTQLTSRVTKHVFAAWKEATGLERQFREKTIELHQFRIQLLTRTAIQQLLQHGKHRRVVRLQLETCQRVSRCLQLKRAIVRLSSNKNHRISDKSRCIILNSRFLKRSLFQRWKHVVTRVAAVRLTGARMSRFRVKIAFRRWLSKLLKRIRLAKCRQSLHLSKRFCAWLRHVRKIATLRIQNIAVQNRIAQIRRNFAFRVWRTISVLQLTLLQMANRSKEYHRTRLLSRFWRKWAGLHSMHEGERQLEEKVRFTRDHLRLVRGYVGLLGHYRSGYRIRQFQQDAICVCNLAIQRCALRAWSLAYADNFRIRQMRRVAIRTWRKFLWRRVTTAVQILRFMERLHLIYTRNLRRRLLLQWKRVQFLKQRFSMFISTRKINVERSLLQKWSQYMKKSRTKRESFAFLCRQLAIKCPFLHSKLHSTSQKLEFFFSSWRFWVRCRCKKKDTYKQMTSDWNQKRHISIQTRMFDIWYRAFISNQYQKRFASLHQSQTVRLWLRWIRDRREIRQLMSSALLFYRRYRLTISFEKWQHRLLTVWKLENINRLLATRHREYILRQYTSSWLERFLAKYHERESYLRALEHYHVQLQRKAFVAFRTRTQHSAQHAKKTAALIDQYRLQVEQACFRAWSFYARRRRLHHETRRQQEMALLSKRNVLLYWRMYVRRIGSTRRMLKK